MMVAEENKGSMGSELAEVRGASMTTKATMTDSWREELVKCIATVWETKGEQRALEMLAKVGEVYGEEEECRIATEVMQGRAE